MRKAMLLAPAAARRPAPRSHRNPTSIGTVPGRICNAAGTDAFIGQHGTSESGAAILMRDPRAPSCAGRRMATMMTMDYQRAAGDRPARPAPTGSPTINCG